MTLILECNPIGILLAISALFSFISSSHVHAQQSSPNDKRSPHLLDDIISTEELGLGLNKVILESRTMKNNDISAACLKQLIALQLQYSQGEGEAMLFLDAAGKPGPGLRLGNKFMIGSYQECTNWISNGHFCTANIAADLNKLGLKISYDLTWAFCAPSQCSAKRLETNYSDYVHLTGDGGADTLFCDVPKDSSSAGFIVTIIICSLFVLFALIGTFVDWWFTNQKLNIDVQYTSMSNDSLADSRNALFNDDANQLPKDDVPQSMLLSQRSDEGSILVKILKSFSIPRNAQLILSTDVPRGAITSINGVRLFSMWWVILGHTYSFNGLYIDNFLEEGKLSERITFMVVLNGVFSVDSFFLLSGLLVSYLTLKRVDSSKGMSWITFYLHRYLRLTPSYAVVILCFIYFVPIITEGPSSPIMNVAIEGCKNKWWTNMIYINNFYKLDQTGCIQWTWYLANDMQFFIISPIIILIMWRLKWLGAFAINGLLLIASFIVTGVLINKYNLNLDSYGHRAALGNHGDDTNIIYTKPYCRISPYLIGLLLGYVFHKKAQFPLRMRKVAMAIGWICSIVVALSVVYGVWGDHKAGGSPMTDAGNLTYGVFSRFAWACALAWLIYACHTGYGGYLNSFLSWRGFIPLSRLTYAAYLLHPIVIYAFILSAQVPFHYTDLKIIYYFASFVMVSYGCAFVLALLVEYPLMNIEQLILKRKKE